MFGSVDVKARPIKLAYLVDPDSATQVREAFRLSSTLWGGTYFPIIILYKQMPATWRDTPLKAPLAKDVIFGYIEAFDPDVLVQLSKEVPDFVKETGLKIIQPSEIWSVLDEGLFSPRFGLGIFELLNDVFEEHFKYKKKYPLRVVLPRIPRTIPLFWASLFGEIPPKIMPFIEGEYFEPLEIQEMRFDADKLSDVMARNVLFPRRIAQRGLNLASRSRARRDAYVFLLDAEKVRDVVDFWNLRALGKQVMPVPKQLRDHPQLKEIVVSFLKAHRRPRKYGSSYDLASIIGARGSTLDDLKDYTSTLSITRGPDDASKEPFFALQIQHPRIWSEWARDKAGELPDDVYGDEESIEVKDPKGIKLRALLPKFAFKYGHHGAPRCANEISFRFYGSDVYLAEVFPKASGDHFTRAIAGMISFREWRVGRNGLVRIVGEGFSETRDIPTAEEVFFAWLTDAGWKPQLSAAGLLAKQISKKLGGHLATLRNKRLLGLLEHMNGGQVKMDGSPAEKFKLSRERDLPVGAVRDFLGKSEEYNLLGYLISKEIFKLGLKAQCPQCQRKSWFSLEDVRDTLSCPQCLTTFPAIGHIDRTNAKWHYKTAGAFSVPDYAGGAYAVLLTADFFSEHRLPTIRTTPVLSFTTEGPANRKIEADFAMFWEESPYGQRSSGILLGECKTYNEFEGKDFDRMRFLAGIFPGAVLVFATLRESLTPGEVEQIAEIAKAGREYWKNDQPINPVLILTGTELLSWQGPPYCWQDHDRQRFDHAHGLFDICNATQQIYLNLPSWHAQWDEEWKKGRQRPKAKKSSS